MISCVEEKKEIISAWVDGECSTEEIQQCLEAINSQPELFKYWEQCHAMRDIIEQRYTETASLPFCEQISARIDALPALTGRSTKKVVPLRTGKPTFRWAQIALAASVAFMTIILVNMQSPEPPQQVAVTKKISTKEIKVALPANSHNTEEPLATLDNRIAVDSEGNMYLAEELINDKRHFAPHDRRGNPYATQVDY